MHCQATNKCLFDFCYNYKNVTMEDQVAALNNKEPLLQFLQNSCYFLDINMLGPKPRGKLFRVELVDKQGWKRLIFDYDIIAHAIVSQSISSKPNN